MSFLSGVTQFFSRSNSAAKSTPKNVSKVNVKQENFNPSSIKVPKQPQGSAVYLTKSAMSSGQPLKVDERNLVNTDITNFSKDRDTQKVIRNFALAMPDLSASVDAYIRMAVTKSYKAVAKNLDGTFNRDATTALQSILTRFNVLKNYEEGFSNTASIRAVAEMLAKEFRYYGAGALELVLDKQRMPVRLQPITVTSIQFVPEKDKSLKPVQKVDGDEIDLDIPTFFYRSIDQDLLSAYPNSPMEAALQPALFNQQFMNDLRRIVRQAIHPRIKISVNTESILAQMPHSYYELSEDEDEKDRINKYIESIVNDVAYEVNNMAPEDAFVFTDSIDVSYMTAGNNSHDTEIANLQSMIDAKVATGTKTLPAILGYGSASSNIASTESLLFMKSAEGVQFALNDIFSQALTLAMRLVGYDVYVDFAFDPINLRPDVELEAFASMEQSRVLELLSLGFISEDEAGLALNGKLAPEGMAPLAGTRFTVNKSSGSDNPYSNTSPGTLNQNLNQTDTPKNPKSKNGGKTGN
jgi:hypothetical protein